ncbi:unnamed protein product [Allacma fusca]|uniref:carbonyl reductase (NADPH) n=1 Tax=Allacma fusca TaxID=39272 RepID=A0A8J2JI65_9HEXA|nr:unnamed protein product [Allacma fusca]
MSKTKIAIVTGSNKGIGLAIVKQLCKKFDGKVYLTSRDETRGKEAVAALEKLGLRPLYHQLDIDCMDSIREFRKYLEQTHGGIDILINNAAMAYKNNAKEPFGEQARNTVRVNYFGTLNVCRELFPLLRKHARVVHLSSYAGHLLKIQGIEPEASELRHQFSSPDATEASISNLANVFISKAQAGTHLDYGWPDSTYIVSKVAVAALGPIHQKLLDKKRPNDDIIVNIVNPGYVDTDMTSHKGFLTVDEGAACPVYLALLPPHTKSPRGSFVDTDKSIVDWIHGPVPTPVPSK